MKNPIINLLLILVALIVGGCNTTRFDATKPDGTRLVITNTRFLWATDSYVATFTTNGASLSANKSNVDREALGVIVSAAVSAAAKSTVP